MARRKIGGYRLYWRTKEQTGGVALLLDRGEANIAANSAGDLAGLVAVFRDFPDIYIDDEGIVHTDLLKPGTVKD